MIPVPSISSSSSLLISQEENLLILQEIFFDALLLDYNFKIQSIGQSVSGHLGFTADELKDKSIDLILPDFLSQIVPLLENGFFSQKKFHLKSKWNDLISVKLSGFYTGLLTDINGFIILRYENLEDVLSVQQQLDAKTQEMDHFIYQASHSLRGPLATIKGLINIAKVEQDLTKLNFIHQQMDEFASRLDTKLYKLMCFAEVDRTTGIPSGTIDQTELQTKLSMLGLLDTETISIDCAVINMEGLPINEHLVESILLNLISFILTANRNINANIKIAIRGGFKVIELELATSGFEFDLPFQNVLVGEHGYGHLLEQPDFTSIYSIKKMIFRLQGKITFELTDILRSNIKVVIPYNFLSLSKNDVR